MEYPWSWQSPQAAQKAYREMSCRPPLEAACIPPYPGKVHSRPDSRDFRRMRSPASGYRQKGRSGMRRRIIVTDLTRFGRPDIVCIAGADPRNGECIRPMPYLEAEKCRALNILPGTLLSGNFSVPPEREGPHQEDYFHRDLKVEGACTPSEFKAALEFHCDHRVRNG